MKTIIFLAVIAFAAGDVEYYKFKAASTSQLANTERFKILIDCLLDRAPCSEVHKIYKAVCAESVEQKCKRCTPPQKNAFWVFLQVIKAKFPNDYVSFRQKYDPENKHFKDLELELSKYSSTF